MKNSLVGDLLVVALLVGIFFLITPTPIPSDRERETGPYPKGTIRLAPFTANASKSVRSGHGESVVDANDAGIFHDGEARALAQAVRGYAALKKSDYNQALRLLRSAHEALPDHLMICASLAHTYDQLGLFADAVELIPCLEAGHRRGIPAVDRTLERLEGIAEFEYSFESATSDHFLASYPDGGVVALRVGEILDMLERARLDVGARIGFASQRTIPVVIYEGEQYAEATDAPHWAPALYDGKIRMPIHDFETDRREFRESLTHEYTHALLHELTGARLPTWFTEGVAMLAAEERIAEGSTQRRSSWVAFPFDLDQLTLSFASSSTEAVASAYSVSFAMTSILVDELGWETIGALLEALRSDPQRDFDDAFVSVYGESPTAYLDRLRVDSVAWSDERR